MAHLSRFQHLVHGVVEAVSIGEHSGVKLFLLLFAHTARLQSLQIEPDRRDRCLQFMSDCIDEAILLLAAADLTYKKDGVNHKSGDDQRKENDAEDQQRQIAPMDHD